MNDISAVVAIAGRDLLKFLRDPARLIVTFLVPFLLMFLLGTTAQLNLGRYVGFNFVGFTFTGVLGLTLFQSSVQGMASLLDDRQNDFAQELFVSPISRYTIVLGKIVGEAAVALMQAVPLVVFALLLGVALSPRQIMLLVPVAILACLLGGSFGLLAMSLINSRQAANQIFNFLLLPQLFLAGVFTPIATLPWYIELLSLLSPLRYVVDLFRGILYAGRPEYDALVLFGAPANVVIVVLMFILFMSVGTVLFARRETNR